MSNEEWEAALERSRPARLRVAPDVVQRNHFSREDRGDERAEWERDVTAHHMPTIPPSARPPHNAIFLLPSDVVSHWFEEIEAAETVTLVTNGVRYSHLAEDWVTRDGIVIFELRRRLVTPEQIDEMIEEDLSLCLIAPDWPACKLTASVEGLCESFWWLTPDGVAMYDIVMKWPILAACDLEEDTRGPGEPASVGSLVNFDDILRDVVERVVDQRLSEAKAAPRSDL